MVRRLFRFFLKSVAFWVLIACSLVLTFYSIRWLTRPAPESAEGLLARADDLGWNNNWSAAFPLFGKAQLLFEKRGDYEHALYAKVSQIPVLMESRSLAPLILELNRDLDSPSAKDPRVRLRVLEMKARCEEEYNAGLAVQTYEKVEDLALRQYKPHLASRASGERGILAFTLGNFEEAATRVKRAYAVARFLGDPTAHVRFASMIGLGLEQMGRYQQALVFLDEAIQTQAKHPDVAIPYVAINAKIDALSGLGMYPKALALADASIPRLRSGKYFGQLQSVLTSRSGAVLRSGKIDSAIFGYREALGYAQKLSAWRAIAAIQTSLASAYERKGDLPAALASVEGAIQANKQTPQEMFLVPGNLTLKAKILTEMGRRADAERLYARGADVIDVLLSHVPTPEVERSLLAQLGDLYSEYFRLVSDEGRLSDAFNIIERAHGRIEAQQLSFDTISFAQENDPEELRLQQLELKLIDDSRVGASSGEALRQAPIPAVDHFADHKANSPVPLKAIQKQLGEGELLVEYVLAEPCSYALAVDRGHISRFVLPSKRQIEDDVKRYRAAIQKHSAATVEATGKRLFDEVLSFAKNYSGFSSFIFIADGDLHLLPFSALVNERGEYLIENRNVSLAPSGTVLSILRSKKSGNSHAREYLGVAPWTEPANAQSWILKSRGGGENGVALSPLPKSRDEVESIAAMMQRPSTLLIGSQATKQRFQSLPLQDYRIMHLALHGILDPVFPDRSSLAFAPSRGDNGRLAAREISRLRLTADLVTLSACDTAVGPVSAAGVESLHSAFIGAGAESVVSSLWELQDSYTDTFMKSFYSHLREKDKTHALRDAKVDLVRQHVDPFYWAAFELVGNPSGSPFLKSEQIASY